MEWKQIPKILLAAPSSGAGKTVITCGLLAALKRRGLVPAAFKCGPDYIDPMFHKEILGVESGNLDGFFQDRELMQESFLCGCAGADIAVIEGVMGFFDGLGGVTSRASSWETARWLDSPVLLVVDGRGASLSIAASVQGFLEFVPDETGAQAGSGSRKESGPNRQRPDNGISGILLNRVSPGMFPMLKKMLEERFAVPVVGYVPKLEWLHLESRHLGLKLPGEVEDLQAQTERFAKQLEETVDLELLLQIAGRRADVKADQVSEASGDKDMAVNTDAAMDESIAASISTDIDADTATSIKISTAAEEGTDADKSTAGAIGRSVQICSRKHWSDEKSRIVIGVALDEAFCFYYRDNLRMLQQAGARLEFFSPIHQKRFPSGADGLLFGGGYPELYARQLSENTSMCRAVSQAAQSGMPILGECGGFLYLQEELEDETGRSYPMAGALSGSGRSAGRLSRFGYVTLSANCDGIYFRKGEEIRAHEFHYWDSDLCGDAMEAKKPVGSRKWLCMRQEKRILAGFPHLYYPSLPELPNRFAEQCRVYQKERKARR